jgi:hypothetical protein
MVADELTLTMLDGSVIVVHSDGEVRLNGSD